MRDLVSWFKPGDPVVIDGAVSGVVEEVIFTRFSDVPVLLVNTRIGGFPASFRVSAQSACAPHGNAEVR